MANDPLVPINTPFSYNVGINYESWENGRTGYSITADLNQITQYFGLIKTYHDVAVGTANPSIPTIDPTQQQVISYVVNAPNVQLAMGTLNSALAYVDQNGSWTAGFMTSQAYTNQWVKMIVQAFGSAQAVQAHLKIVLLGNELDQNGPPPTDTVAFNKYKGWINTAFDNLSRSLKAAGLGSIPVSTTIANYGPTNAVAVSATAHIQQNWSKAWNGGKPIVLFNQYTQPMSSTQYAPVINYFESVYTQLKGAVEPFVGETGYSSYYGQANQVSVYNQISKWLDGQYTSSQGKTVPLFAFDAFNQPSQSPADQVQFGIFGQNGSSQPTGLKPGLKLPTWTKTPISTSGNNKLALFSGVFTPGVTIDGGAGIDTLLLAEPQTVDFVPGKLVSIERLNGSSGADTVTMTASQLLAFGGIDLGDGTDVLNVAVRGTFGFTPDIPVLGGIEALNLFGSGEISLNLIHLGPSTALTLSSVHATVAQNRGYAGSFSTNTFAQLTIDADALLSLSGPASFFRTTIDGAGRLATAGATSVTQVALGGTAEWFNYGTLAERGGVLTIGDGAGNIATFNNLASGVFDLAGNVHIGIGAGTGASIFRNSGLLIKTAGGSSRIATQVINTGIIEAASGMLDLQQGVRGPEGILKIDAGKAMQIDGAVSGQTVDFNGGGDRLILTDAAHFHGKLQDFGAGDRLDLRELDPATTTLGFSETGGSTQGMLTVTDGSLHVAIALLGQYSASAFRTSSDGLGGTLITHAPPAAQDQVLAAHG
jgi:hypothetical protein